MLTGVHPHRHGVLSWQHRLGDVPSALNFTGYDNAFYHPGPESVLNDGTFAILGEDERRSIDELSSPWMYVERHHGGHAPFNAIEQWKGDWSKFVDEFAGDAEKLRHYYDRAVSATAADFQQRLDAIEARGELDETLVVFCSDHGEYLGESGFVDHSSPIRPEGVYVPMVFVHPDIEPGSGADGIARHVDLFPTLLAALGEELPSHLDGVDLRRSHPERGYCHARAHVSVGGRQVQTYDADSLWDAHGGYIWNNTTISKRLALASGLLLGRSWSSRHLRNTPRNSLSAMRHYLAREQSFGEPEFSRKQGEAILTDILNRSPLGVTEQERLDADTEDQLQNLGYL